MINAASRSILVGVSRSWVLLGVVRQNYQLKRVSGTTISCCLGRLRPPVKMSIFTPDRSLYIQLWTISPSRSGHSCVKPANCMFNLLAPSKYRSFGRELSQILFSAYICPAFTHQILSSPLAVFPSQKSSDENGGPRGKDLGTLFAGRHCLF